MIVKITRGDRTQGLMSYLVGPGRGNEHTSPHLVAGSAGVMTWYGDDELSPGNAISIGNLMDLPRKVSGTKITVPVKTYDETLGRKVATGERCDAHVWHCSLSLPPTDATGHPNIPLDEEKWAAIARDFADGMEFSDAAGKAACRWVAVHHGQSVNGGDHIHLAVQLVREDGTKASTHNDYKRASRIVADLERKHGLEVVAGRQVGRSVRPEIRAEVEIAARAGQLETYSRRLGRTVRGCATASRTEDEFVRRCRSERLWVRPRFAAGGQDVVTGFSVAEAPAAGNRAVWKGAGQLGRDLTLPRLRDTWPDHPETAVAAAAEWRAAWRGHPTVGAGAEIETPDPALWKRYSAELGRIRTQLAEVPVNDHATWSRVARETSGVFAAWSLRTEEIPGPLADTSDQLARGAALHARVIQQRPGLPVSMRGPAYLVMALAADPESRTAQALLLRQLLNTMRAIHHAQTSTAQAREARQVAGVVQDRLRLVVEGLPPAPAETPLSTADGRRNARPGPRPSETSGPPHSGLAAPLPGAVPERPQAPGRTEGRGGVAR